MIDSFSGEYRWLSNFWPCKVTLNGVEYPSVECAYQAAKTLKTAERIPFQSATASEAKRLGRSLTTRPDWDEVKLSIMEGLLKQKFSQPWFKQKLESTGEEELVEGNYWNDTFWGVCRGRGENHLGKLLMKIRAS